MIEPRPFATLGRFDNDWLTARYHFSFAGYHDPARMGVGPLRVWNDDRIDVGGGFDLHGHRDMEIITYVRRGALAHRDHLGNEGRIAAGEVQVMSAGNGIMHSEHNAGGAEATELFQIWVEPRERSVAPRWETRPAVDGAPGTFHVLASGRPADRDLDVPAIGQDAALLRASVAAGATTDYRLAAGRSAYAVVAEGQVTLNGTDLSARDGAVARDAGDLSLTALADSVVLLMDLP